MNATDLVRGVVGLGRLVAAASTLEEDVSRMAQAGAAALAATGFPLGVLFEVAKHVRSGDPITALSVLRNDSAVRRWSDDWSSGAGVVRRRRRR